MRTLVGKTIYLTTLPLSLRGSFVGTVGWRPTGIQTPSSCVWFLSRDDRNEDGVVKAPHAGVATASVCIASSTWQAGSRVSKLSSYAAALLTCAMISTGGA